MAKETISKDRRQVSVVVGTGDLKKLFPSEVLFGLSPVVDEATSGETEDKQVEIHLSEFNPKDFQEFLCLCRTKKKPGLVSVKKILPIAKFLCVDFCSQGGSLETERNTLKDCRRASWPTIPCPPKIKDFADNLYCEYDQAVREEKEKRTKELPVPVCVSSDKICEQCQQLKACHGCLTWECEICATDLEMVKLFEEYHNGVDPDVYEDKYGRRVLRVNMP
jgi:hypothetical protein